PLRLISSTPLQSFGLRIKTYEPVSPDWFDEIGLGLRVWHGEFEQSDDDWLRWCDSSGQPIPLGVERAVDAENRAGQAEQRAGEAEPRGQCVPRQSLGTRRLHSRRLAPLATAALNSACNPWRIAYSPRLRPQTISVHGCAARGIAARGRRRGIESGHDGSWA